MQSIVTILAVAAFGASDTAPLAVEVAPGFHGFYRAASWVPVRVTVKNTRGDLTGRLRVEAWRGGGKPTAAASRSFESPKASMKTCILQVFLANGEDCVRAEFLDRSDEVVAAGECVITQPEAEHCEVFGAVGPITIQLYPADRAGEESKRHVLASIDPSKLPDQIESFDTFSALILARPYAPIGSASTEALLAWVRGGGRAVVTIGGRQGEYARSAWPSFTGIAVARTTETDLGPELTRQVEGSPALNWPTQISELAGPGEVVLTANGRPLALRVRVGSGTVTLLGFDASAKPFRDWSGMPAMWQRLLQTEPLGLTLAETAYPRLTTTEMLQNLVRHAGSRELGLVWVVPLIIVYIILIGPVDYALSRKASRRRITWITFPSYVIGFSLIIYLGARYTKQGAMTYRHVTVYDAASGSTTARVTKWFSIYPPASKVYRIACRQANQFIGLAESGTTDLARRPETRYESDSTATLAVALPQWSSQMLRADGEVDAPAFTAVLRLGKSAATLKIDGELPISLPKADLVYGRWVVPLENVQTGRELTVKLDRPIRDHLTQEFSGSDSDQIAGQISRYAPWSQCLFLSLRRECDRHLSPRRAPIFHSRLDLTRHLTSDGAYLLGAVHGDVSGERVMVDGRRVELEPNNTSRVFVRYRVDVQHQ